MRKNIIILAIMSFMPIFAVAQDDMYIYKQKDVDKYNKSIKEYSAYYSGIDKSNEDYNRHGKLRKTFNVIGQDSLGNDIIQYIRNGRTGRSLVVDTLYGDYMRNFNYDNDDFAYSRRMSRFDDYYGSYYDPWLDIDYYDPFYYDVRWRYNSPFRRGWYDLGITLIIRVGITHLIFMMAGMTLIMVIIDGVEYILTMAMAVDTIMGFLIIVVSILIKVIQVLLIIGEVEGVIIKLFVIMIIAMFVPLVMNNAHLVIGIEHSMRILEEIVETLKAHVQTIHFLLRNLRVECLTEEVLEAQVMAALIEETTLVAIDEGYHIV
ncbi:hypothetical protein [Prevotella amnii]|uniref:hypothetical protein n=1 Tax=Prevotella amnii TaxID=419005 RepID=UPI000A55E205|nr:hypothetical protein [Prevotella amnii]